MAVVMIQASSLSREQKQRIGDRMIVAFQQEGIAPGGVVVLFRDIAQDLYLDGSFFPDSTVVAATPPAPAPATPSRHAEPPAVPEAPAVDLKAGGRRTKGQLQEIKQRLIQKLQLAGSLSSFEAQESLGLKDFDWAPGTLRRLFTDLEDERLITKTGQKRGTRYQWKGIVSTQAAAPTVKLVKAESEPESGPEAEPEA
jgi:hypothetical protein